MINTGLGLSVAPPLVGLLGERLKSFSDALSALAAICGVITAAAFAIALWRMSLSAAVRRGDTDEFRG